MSAKTIPHAETCQDQKCRGNCKNPGSAVRVQRLVRLTEIERRYLVFMWRDAALKIRRLARVADHDAKDHLHRDAKQAEQRAKFLADRPSPNDPS